MLIIDSVVLQLYLLVCFGGDMYVGFVLFVYGLDVLVIMICLVRLECSVIIDFLIGNVIYVIDGQGGLFGEGILCFDEIGIILLYSLCCELIIYFDDLVMVVYILC